MRFTYVREDKKVKIDGELFFIDNSNFDQSIDAIQWYDSYGEIEFVNRAEKNNEIFDNISYIQPLIDLWNFQKENQLTNTVEIIVSPPEISLPLI